MPGVANLYASNAKLWVSVSSAPVYSPGTSVRIFWRPLEGAKTSGSTITESTSVRYCLLNKVTRGRKTMPFAYKLIY